MKLTSTIVTMIVGGSHGRTMAAEILLGSVANAVIQNTTRPVLVIRVKVKEQAGQMICEDVTCDTGKHVLFPTDFSSVANYVARYSLVPLLFVPPLLSQTASVHRGYSTTI